MQLNPGAGPVRIFLKAHRMVHTVNTAPAPFGAITVFRVVNFTFGLAQSVVAWKEERDTLRVLSKLSPEQLEDVGLTRNGRV